jgi:hypothetical protein
LNHWLIMFRPETYAAARQHGLMAVLNMHRRRFSEVRPGDRFVAYVSRERVLDGHGEVLDEPYQEASEVPAGWLHYTERVRVRFDDTGKRRDGRVALWGLAVCSEGINTEPTNLLLVKGGFLKIPAEDYAWLRRILEEGEGVVGERVAASPS